MALLQIIDLSFGYPGSLAPVFEHVDLELDTSWHLGLIGRNGRGKTTFLRLLLGQLSGTGRIVSPVPFEYFPPAESPAEDTTALSVARSIIAPFDEWEEEMQRLAQAGDAASIARYGDIEEQYAEADGYDINERIAAEMGRLDVQPGALGQSWHSLSGGEKVKLQLAALFLKKHRFLLIDEPTDHLDTAGRKAVAKWLQSKSGFILVSHDRDFLNEAVDHILSINRAGIELQKGNYSTWRHNRTLQDEFEKAENQKLEASIRRLKEAAARTERWSDNIEKSKIGGRDAASGPAFVDKGYIGHQAARMMQRSKSIEKRRSREIEQKQALLKNLEESEPLKFQLLAPDKSRLLWAEDISFGYGPRALFTGLSLDILRGERIAITGPNGSGKSTLLKILAGDLAPTNGVVRRMGGLVISALPQDCGFLHGPLRGFAAEEGLSIPLFFAILRKLDFEREAFERPMQSYSTGQKKKVCLAASLATPAHLFLWDEPLNYIDVLSREQIEQAVKDCAPTLVFVEHDAAFVRGAATRELRL